MTEHRNARIDLMRGIAIFLVLLLHFHLSFKIENTFIGSMIPINLLHAIVVNGNYAVTMFFVLSGYLITDRSIQRYGKLSNISLSSFYRLRFARIIPMLVLALLLISILSLLGFEAFLNKQNTVSMWLSNFSILTFWHNILMQKYEYFNYAMNIYWSLSVEEMFYLLFPIICVVFRKKSMLYLLATALIIICPIYRYLHSNNEIFFMYGCFGCFDAIAIGCLTAILKKNDFDKYFTSKAIQILALSTLCITHLLGIYEHETLGFTSIAFMTAILILGSTKTTLSATSHHRFISYGVRYMGKISYELYLLHIIVLGIMRNYFLAPSLTVSTTNLLLVTFMCLSFIISTICHHYYSEPLNKKIRNIKYLAIIRAAHE